MTTKEPKPSTPEELSPREIAQIYRRNEQGIHHGSKVFYPGDMLLGQLDEDGHGEMFDNIIIAGSTTLGLSRVYGEGGLQSVRLSAIGETLQEQMPTAIAQVDLDALRKPRENGVIQEWEDIPVGRATIYNATKVVDAAISREHFNLRVFADGRIELTDNSLGGTTVIQGRDLMQDESAGGFSMEDRSGLVGFIESLARNQNLWQISEESPGVDIGTPGLGAGEAQPESSTLKNEITRAKAHADEIWKSLEEADRRPAWLYAVAVHEYELTNAMRQLSQEGKSKAIAYRDAFRYLKKLEASQP